MRRHRIAGLGIGRTFQNLALFRSMTVRENVLAGAHPLGRTGFVANALRLPAARREEERADARLAQILAPARPRRVAGTVVARLPFGTQKRVELARALIAGPKLLLLDEPAGGLNHAEVQEMEQLLRAIRARFRLSILLVEHHMNLVMRVSDEWWRWSRASRSPTARRTGAPGTRGDPRLSGRRRAMKPLLECRDLRAWYGDTPVLHGFSLAVAEGGVTALLGANGAGKTTTLRAICGMVRTQGEIRLAGRRIEGSPTEEIARRGVAHVPTGAARSSS